MANILKALIKLFRPIKQLGPLTNRARLFSAYETIFELLMIISNYSFFRVINQFMLIHILLVFSIVTMSANYLTNITHPMRFFYSAYLNIIAAIIALIFTLILFSRLLNLSQLCNLFSNYATRQLDVTEEPNYLKICITQKVYYIIWLLINFLAIFMKGLGIYFSLKAHSKIKLSLIKDIRNPKFE